jgi:hypothetical protein
MKSSGLSAAKRASKRSDHRRCDAAALQLAELVAQRGDARRRQRRLPGRRAK